MFFRNRQDVLDLENLRRQVQALESELAESRSQSAGSSAELSTVRQQLEHARQGAANLSAELGSIKEHVGQAE